MTGEVRTGRREDQRLATKFVASAAMDPNANRQAFAPGERDRGAFMSESSTSAT